MKQITVTIKRETQVTVSVDETIVNKQVLNAIQLHFDNELFEPNDISMRVHEDDMTEEEVGYYNYAKYAALHAIGQESEFITLTEGHTTAEIDRTDVEFEFDELL